MSGTPFTAASRAELAQRSGGVCEICRLQRAVHAHHRLPQGNGGKGTADNGLHLCSECHRFVHDNPAVSYAYGWLLHAEPVNMGLKS